MKRFVACAVFAGLFVPSLAHAGGFTQAEGASYAKVWGTAVVGENGIDVDGELFPTASFSLLSLSMYGELGLRDDLTVLASMRPLGRAQHGEQVRAFTGNLLAGFRQRFVSDPIHFAIEARFGGSPGFGGESDMAPESDAYVFVPSQRTLTTEWELQVGVPLSFGWATAGFGPRWYSSATLDDELFGFAQVGFGPFGGFVFDLHTTLNQPLRQLEQANVAGVGNTRYVGAGAGASWWITSGFAVNLAADIAPMAQSNAGAPALQLGVEFRGD